MNKGKFSLDSFIELDYTKIKDEVKKNILTNIKNEKLRKHNMVKLMCYVLVTCLLCTISVITSIKIYSHKYLNQSQQSPNINVYKSTQDITDNFDLCVAFTNKINFETEGITISQIVKTNLLKDSDKAYLSSISNDKVQNKFICYLVVIDGKDFVYLKSISFNDLNYKFESNLPYSLISIVEEFEQLSNSKISTEWLNDDTYDQENNLRTGISLNFIETNTDCYKEYYTAVINQNIYVLNK